MIFPYGLLRRRRLEITADPAGGDIELARYELKADGLLDWVRMSVALEFRGVLSFVSGLEHDWGTDQFC